MFALLADVRTVWSCCSSVVQVRARSVAQRCAGITSDCSYSKMPLWRKKWTLGKEFSKSELAFFSKSVFHDLFDIGVPSLYRCFMEKSRFIYLFLLKSCSLK